MEMMPAERLFQMITGFAVSQSIYVAARLGLADLLKDGAKAADELAKCTGVDSAALSRLLRFLASQEIPIRVAVTISVPSTDDCRHGSGDYRAPGEAAR